MLLQLKAGSNADTLINMIRDVSKGLKRQVKDAKDSAEEKHDECDADVRDLSRGIFEAQARWAKADGVSAADATTLGNRKAEWKTKTAELAARNQMLGVLKEQRLAEMEKYDGLTAEYRSVFDALDQCRVVINERLLAGGEFL